MSNGVHALEGSEAFAHISAAFAHISAAFAHISAACTKREKVNGWATHGWESMQDKARQEVLPGKGDQVEGSV